MEDKKVVSLAKARHDTEGALEVVQHLKEQVEAGDIRAFSTIAITTDGNLTLFSAQVLPTGRLEMIGAMSLLLDTYINGNDLYE